MHHDVDHDQDCGMVVCRPRYMLILGSLVVTWRKPRGASVDCGEESSSLLLVAVVTTVLMGWRGSYDLTSQWALHFSLTTVLDEIESHSIKCPNDRTNGVLQSDSRRGFTYTIYLHANGRNEVTGGTTQS